ncbi:Pimeloyl-ACP methyl ester carboxylesterase [Psychrobacillus sp. OK028]|uniref:intracellular short-chain-length polyhydroxyalkanoate depolymerase n=1 Tax=Psychrobacillus sp. OK028 TaxID=1884359 RepID=UPI000883A337|nr:alpha/beta hydrolase [Psychrobacillus sp. OK028]SDN11172.1 Pimeloyl-ACP methyl ester carboxylesterase [Psychrobacillus sp. OK028]
MSLPKISLSNGEEIAYRVRPGGEEIIVLVHGNMTSSMHWDVLIDKLDPRFTIYAVDLRGFGESTYHKRIQGIKDFSDDLSEVIVALNLQKFYLIGWSTGGAICMQYVADHPARCEKLVLLASASTRGYPFYGLQEDGTPDLNRRLKTIEDVEEDPNKTLIVQGLYDTANKEGLKAIWNAAIYSHKQPADDAYDNYLDDMLTQRNLADVYHALNTFNISGTNNGLTEGTDKAKDITIPVLILRGDRDYVVSEQMTQEIVADLGDNATYIPLIDCGHSPLIDDLEQLTNRIEAFLVKGDDRL